MKGGRLFGWPHRENDHPGNQQKKTIFPNHLLQSSGADWPPKTNHTTHTIGKDSSDPIKSNKLPSMWWNNQLCKLHDNKVRITRPMVFPMVTQNESTATKKLTKKVENEKNKCFCVLFLYLCTHLWRSPPFHKSPYAKFTFTTAIWCTLSRNLFFFETSETRCIVSGQVELL